MPITIVLIEDERRERRPRRPQSILAKLHLDNRIQAAAHAVRTGIS